MYYKNDYEKIDLSKKDFSNYLNTMMQAAMVKLNLHLPENDDDPIKNRIIETLEQFLFNSFDITKHAVSADGRDLSNANIRDILSLRTMQNVESIDPAITSQLRNIIHQFEEETTEVIRLRRELPAQASEVYTDITKRVDNEVSEIINQIEQECAQQDDEIEEEHVDLDYDMINKNYTTQLELLKETNSVLPSLIRQVEKYKKTVWFLEESYKQQSKEMI
ncbi:NSL1 Kinetochore-associated protein NSL1 [Candida maltosa Xu316]|uniref:Kinetochore complex subunit, putative n=1 Tax=Candida maltosa (strain Xu316) TaxID=1245528 RepID=M3IMN9_CANMX|nr:Kinetochore complex subunit, putative [Candida maltosa Xu316]